MTSTADLDRFIEDLHRARYGDPRFGHEDFTPFPALIARADELGDPYWQFMARLEAAGASRWAATASETLTLVAWLLRTYNSPSVTLRLSDDDVSQLHRATAGLFDDIEGVPELSIAQIEALVADWERMVAGTRYASPSVGAAVRARLALQRGDHAAARSFLDDVTDHRSPAFTCERGVRSFLAGLYSDVGDHERAIELAAPDLVSTGGHCNFYPAETHVGLLPAYAALGRRGHVIRSARAVADLYSAFPRSENPTVAIVALLTVDAFDEAYQIAIDRFAHLNAVYTALSRARRSAAISAVFASLAQADPDALVNVRAAAGRPADARPAGDVADELAEAAREIAATFDRRNGGTGVSAEIERTLALRARSAQVSGVKSIAERTVHELVSGARAFARSSEHRAESCVRALAGRLDELDGTDLVRAQCVISFSRMAHDPERAISELRATVDAVPSGHPAVLAHARLLADVCAAEWAGADMAPVVSAPAADRSWSALAQSSYNELLARAVGVSDVVCARALIDQSLAAVTLAQRGELPASETPREDDGPSVDADLASASTRLRLLAAAIATDAHAADAHADAAVVAARRAVAASSTSDQALEMSGELVDALTAAAARHSGLDLVGARLLVDEALEYAKYDARARVLQRRAEIATEQDDYNAAVTDYEAAIAVWTVEGHDHLADAALLDLSRVRLSWNDPAREVVDDVRPVIDRMAERGDVRSAAVGWELLGRAQVELWQSADAVVSFSTVLDMAGNDGDPVVLADVRRMRARELVDLGRFGEAVPDYVAASDTFVEHGLNREAAAALRGAATGVAKSGDTAAALAYLDRAASVLALVDSGTSVDVDNARVDLVRADVLRFVDPASAVALLESVVGRATAADWSNLAADALYASALLALDPDGAGMDRAREIVRTGLRLGTGHPGLYDLREDLELFG